jgi:dsRNA-specific ribonuclease
MKAAEFTRRSQELAGWEIVVETYRLGETYFTTISSAGAGARFARAQGASKNEAENAAIEKAGHWLGQTRRFPTTSE